MTVMDSSWTPVNWIVRREGLYLQMTTKVHLARKNGRTRCGRIVGQGAAWWNERNPSREEACHPCWMNQPTGRILSP